MNNEKLYTAADFASYHAGTMPVHDMHALEKAALEDPFLSDALEGYVYTPTATNDIEKLQEKLKLGKQIESPVKSLTSKTWWRVAASIIGLLGLGYLFYTTNTKEDTNSLAKNEQVKEIIIDSNSNYKTETDTMQSLDITFNDNDKLNTEPLTKKDLETKLDTSKISVAGLFNTTQATQRRDAAAEYSPIAAAPGAVVTDAKEEAKPALGEKDYSTVTTNTTWAKDNNTDKKTEQLYIKKQQVLNYYDYNGIVQKPSGGPMQNAIVFFNNTATQTDKDGRFNFKATDTIINASLTAVGFAKQNIVLNKNTTPVFKLDFDNKNLEEVVVTGLGGTQKRKKELASVSSVPKGKLFEVKQQTASEALAGKVSGVQVKSGKDDDAFGDSIQLKKLGTDKERAQITFNNYVLQNIKPLFDDKGNQIKGKVILSFTVNKKGQPRKIKVEQSLTAACDEQAIKLLENAPNWNIKKGMRETVTVNF
jgi:TonB family protein